MSMTEHEAWQEEWLDVLYNEHREQAMEEFTAERLHSYYLDNRSINQPALHALAEARKLIDEHPTAAHIFASIAIEVGLKIALLKPIVYGLVHSESAAGIITDLAIWHTGDRFQKILFKILSDHGGVDLSTFQRKEARKKLWEEIQDVHKKRNVILHRGELISHEDAKQSIVVAAAILEDLFPKVIKAIGLSVSDDGRIGY